MRNVLLSLVVVVVLTAGGLGGTFATWSDSETSGNNTIVTGSLDLKVNGADDQPWGEGVGPLFQIECVVPDLWYYLGNATLWNAGECRQAAHAYVHLKEYVCSNVAPKESMGPGFGHPLPLGCSTGYEDPNMPEIADGVWQWTGTNAGPSDTNLKPEPELVAEWGGKVNCTEVDGIGAEGDECSMGTHTHFVITSNKMAPGAGGHVLHEELELVKWECNEFYLFDLHPCQPKDIHFWVRIKQDTEDLWGRDFIPNPDEEGYDPHQYKLFNDWPSWALMKDKVNLTIEFDLTLADLPGGPSPSPTRPPA
jgi:predicted ribosomally synthesized peptide with SipW-like signal peptide